MDEALDRDPDHYVTTSAAAELVGVSAATIRQWVARGHLQAKGKVDGRSVYHIGDVARAEKATRCRARRVFLAA